MFPLHIRALQLCLLAVCPILKILWCWCWIVAFLDNARLFLIFNACYKFIPHRIIPLTARQVAYLGKTWEYFCPGPSLFPAAGRDGSSRMDEKNWSRCWKEHGLKKFKARCKSIDKLQSSIEEIIMIIKCTLWRKTQRIKYIPAQNVLVHHLNQTENVFSCYLVSDQHSQLFCL